ncbi:hypothetical protein [Sutcliffiella horikoshii]|uniref:Uncharacterized protein n=1 Tax=Sutcliffiella horikoshii TaxID=79883 RepID=A0A5D4TFG0_9BACI|nr:hypothetical protein [Sutcliffiella horikoshii]TYS74540.1 hypothetical protein FZC75_02250 [Sutcliffiella horikoshii]
MLKLKNEVYGQLVADISLEVESDKEHMGMLEADIRMSKIDEGRTLNVVDPVTGEIVATMRVHNAEYKWESYYGEGE